MLMATDKVETIREVDYKLEIIYQNMQAPVRGLISRLFPITIITAPGLATGARRVQALPIREQTTIGPKKWYSGR